MPRTLTIGNNIRAYESHIWVEGEEGEGQQLGDANINDRSPMN